MRDDDVVDLMFNSNTTIILYVYSIGNTNKSDYEYAIFE